MSDSSDSGLRAFMVRRYAELKRRLTLQLGNAELAGDALQETWLRLATGKGAQEPVQYPLSYLLRMATNAALDRLRSDGRYLTGAEVEQVFNELSDPEPGPAQFAEARSEAERLARLIEQMPLRRRRILLLVRVDGLPRQVVARRLGISLSLVDRELKRAHEFLVERMS